jgi:hypothetical protein
MCSPSTSFSRYKAELFSDHLILGVIGSNKFILTSKDSIPNYSGGACLVCRIEKSIEFSAGLNFF